MKPISGNAISQKSTEFDVIHSGLLESVDHMKCQLDEFNLLESISNLSFGVLVQHWRRFIHLIFTSHTHNYRTSVVVRRHEIDFCRRF